MDDYAFRMAQSRGTGGFVSFIMRLRRNWRCRQTFHELLMRDDKHLSDIGLKRDQLAYLAGLSLTRDLSWEAERLQFHNARNRYITSDYLPDH